MRFLEKITKKSKALIINFPNNPTGAVMNQADLAAIADIVTDHDLVLISDEVYSELTYEGGHISTATIGDLPGEDDYFERVLQGICNDRVACRVSLRSKRPLRCGTENSPVRDALRPGHGTDRCT